MNEDWRKAVGVPNRTQWTKDKHERMAAAYARLGLIPGQIKAASKAWMKRRAA